MTAKTCPTGKLGYPNRKAAYRALLASWRDHSRGDTSRHERNAYECETCGEWHLTSWTQEQYEQRSKSWGRR